MTGDGGRFSVLMVCTGNICRSPAAERLALSRWGLGSEAQFSSAGVRGVVGEPVQITMAHLLEMSGAYSGEFEARQLAETHLRDADLVLGMSRRHRSAVLSLHPAATRRTFTLREFARLAAAAAPELTAGAPPVQRLRELVALAPGRRGPGHDPADDDIPDPFGLTADVYEASFASIRESVDAVAAALRGEW